MLLTDIFDWSIKIEIELNWGMSFLDVFTSCVFFIRFGLEISLDCKLATDLIEEVCCEGFIIRAVAGLIIIELDDKVLVSLLLGV